MSDTDDKRDADVFDLEMDLMETLKVGYGLEIQGTGGDHLVSILAKWAYSRDARAPMKRG